MLLRSLLLTLFMVAGQFASAMNFRQDTAAVFSSLRKAELFIDGVSANNRYKDSALHMLMRASRMLSGNVDRDLYYAVQRTKGKLMVVNRSYPEADNLFKGIAAYYHSKGERFKEAAVWEYFGRAFAYDDAKTLQQRRNCFLRAYEILLLTNDRQKIADALGQLADGERGLGNYDKAEKYMLRVISEYKALKYPRIYYGYYMLAEIRLWKNNQEKYFGSRLDCVNAYERDPRRSDEDGPLYYYNLAVAYQNFKKYELAIATYEKGAALSQRVRNFPQYYFGIAYIVDCYLRLKQPQAALRILHKVAADGHPKDLEQQCIFISRELSLKLLLKQDPAVKALIPRFITLFKRYQSEFDGSANPHKVDGFTYNYDVLPQYYIRNGKWGELRSCLALLQGFSKSEMRGNTRLRYAYIKFKIDSVDGNYLSALREHQFMTRINDSTKTVNTENRISELETKYKVIIKDKTIQALNVRSAIQNERLQKAALHRDLILIGTVIVIIFAFVIFVAYRSKQKLNLELQLKQDEIRTTNNSLSALLDSQKVLLVEKEGLVGSLQRSVNEKEWLVKEIHHRIKNNLQIVLSLLYNQTNFLKDSESKKALVNVQNQIQAISIIHQKLYSSNYASSIVLADYVNDLISLLSGIYLKQSGRIRFIQDIGEIDLTIDHAVPLGLFLNEAITNAIKYAFPEQPGTITVQAGTIRPGMLKVSVVDDGKGLPVDFDPEQSNSLGMEMMQVLSKQLHGSFTIESVHGTTLELTFPFEAPDGPLLF